MSDGARRDGRRAAILALDTATTQAVIAVGAPDGEPLGASMWPAGYRHGETLLPNIGRLLGEANIRKSRLRGIVVGTGPGAFTGLRVGLSTVKGLALPTDVPLYVVSSLQALALDILAAPAANGSSRAAVTAVPCLDAGKGEVYVAAYVADPETLVRETAADCRIAAGALPDWLAALPAPPPAVAGNGAERHAVAGRLAVAGPTAVSIGRLALLQRRRGESASLATAVPIYGRPPDITVKKAPKQVP